MVLSKYKACICEGAYEKYKRSGKKPSDYCNMDLKMHDVKSYDFVQEYFADVTKLVDAIKRYRKTANIPKGEYTLLDLILIYAFLYALIEKLSIPCPSS